MGKVYVSIGSTSGDAVAPTRKQYIYIYTYISYIFCLALVAAEVQVILLGMVILSNAWRVV